MGARSLAYLEIAEQLELQERMRTVCGGAVCGSLPSLKKMGRHDMESTAIARSPVAMREPAGCISKRMLLLAVLMLAGAAEAQYQTVVGGSWELVVQQGGVSAMHMFLTRADTVVYFDRTDNGPSQALLPDGQCRNNPRDLALKVDCYAHSMEFNIASNQVRPLFVFSDTWCSSGAFMANGSMVQTGGYNDGEKVSEWSISSRVLVSGRYSRESIYHLHVSQVELVRVTRALAKAGP